MDGSRDVHLDLQRRLDAPARFDPPPPPRDPPRRGGPPPRPPRPEPGPLLMLMPGALLVALAALNLMLVAAGARGGLLAPLGLVLVFGALVFMGYLLRTSGSPDLSLSDHRPPPTP